MRCHLAEPLELEEQCRRKLAPRPGPPTTTCTARPSLSRWTRRAEHPIGALTPLEAGSTDRKVPEDGNKEILEAGSREHQEGSGLERVNLDLEQAEIHWEVGKEHRDKVGSPEER